MPNLLLPNPPKPANITPRLLTAGLSHGRPDGPERRKCTRPERFHRRRVLHQAARRPWRLSYSGRAPGSGHPLREAGSFPKEPDVERSGLFLYYGANKKSAACDIESESGRRRVRDLASGADIVVESFTPGGLDGLIRSRRHIALRLWSLFLPASPLSRGRRRTAPLWCIRRGGRECAGSVYSRPNS